jgi:hypothetical protein
VKKPKNPLPGGRGSVANSLPHKHLLSRARKQAAERPHLFTDPQLRESYAI